MSRAAATAPQPDAAGGGGDKLDQQAVQGVKAQLQLISQDCAHISAPDYATPFRGLDDAVDRLLPYHVFGAEDQAATDARERDDAPRPTGAAAPRLGMTRHEAWQEQCLRVVNEMGVRLFQLDKDVQRVEREALQRSQLPTLMLQSYATAEAGALVAGEDTRRALAEKAARDAVELRQREAQQRAELVQKQADMVQKMQQMQQKQAVEAKQQLQQQVQQQLQQRQQQPLQQPGLAQAAGTSAGQQLPPPLQQPQQQQQQQQLGMLPGLQQQQQQQQQALGGQQSLLRPPGAQAPPGAAIQPGQAAAARPVDPAAAKAAQLAALKARIAQRK